MSTSASPIPGISVERPQRADARRNYDALIVAAREAFAARGIDASLEDIARDAGVGIGTLYRNFPKRRDLFEAVYLNEVEDLCRAAREIGAQDGPAWDIFEAWLRRFSSYVATKIAMLQALDKGSEMFLACRGAMFASAEPIFERGQREGVIRGDVELGDVLKLVSGVVASVYDDDAQRERAFTMALDGIRARA